MRALAYAHRHMMHPLKAWREANELNQTDAAKRLGIAQSDVSRYEAFVSMPGPETVSHLDKIVSGLGTAILVAYYDECRRIALGAQR